MDPISLLSLRFPLDVLTSLYELGSNEIILVATRPDLFRRQGDTPSRDGVSHLVLVVPVELDLAVEVQDTF